MIYNYFLVVVALPWPAFHSLVLDNPASKAYHRVKALLACEIKVTNVCTKHRTSASCLFTNYLADLNINKFFITVVH